VAQIISQVPFEEKLAIFESLKTSLASEVLHELEPDVQKSLIENLKPYLAANVLENMPPDEASDVLGDLGEEKTHELLALMRPRDALAVKKLLKHEDTTAGGLMTTEFIALPENLTVQEVIDKLREMAPDAETIYYLYATGENEELKGVLSLRRLIISQPQIPIKEIMNSQIIKVHPEIDQKEVAELISKYNLLALPVVDQENKILGIITVDDIVDLILPPISRRKRFGLG
jgi:Mg2+ transporter MgtE